MAELKFGVVGLGIASTQILPAFAELEGVSVTAACDIREEGLTKFKSEYGGNTYTSLEDMCKDPNVDAVYVCSPNHLHAEQVIMAAEHGKQVIVEKPMGLTLEECEAMNQAAERNGVRLLCGHTHSFDPPVRKMRELVVSGDYGPLRMVNTWHYNEFMYRPRMPHELNPELGGNVVFNQGPHQVDIIRLIGGGMVRSVRAMTGNWDPSRNTIGAYTVYLEFENGTPATLVYNGYGHFDTAELSWWAGEGPRDEDYNLRIREAADAYENPQLEWDAKEAQRYGGAAERPHRTRDGRPHQFFGLTVVSLEEADIRQTLDGLMVYGDQGREEILIDKAQGSGRAAELSEMFEAVSADRPVFHDGRWGMATLEVVLAIVESADERRELMMEHQVPSPE